MKGQKFESLYPLIDQCFDADLQEQVETDYPGNRLNARRGFCIDGDVTLFNRPNIQGRYLKKLWKYGFNYNFAIEMSKALNKGLEG